MKQMSQAFRADKRLAEHIWGKLPRLALASLKALTFTYGLSVGKGDVLCLEGRWYVTNTGFASPCPSQEVPRYPC
jgi:hypothetical protein